MLKLYNTLTRKKEVFKPIKKNEVGVYSCGPTVYSYQHIGNLRAYLFADTLKRVLQYNNFKVKHAINITDVGHLTSNSDEGEDKIERSAKKEGKSAQEISEYYFNFFHNDLKKSNIIEPNIWCKASSHIKEQIELIKILEKKGYIYKTSDGIYFDTSKFKEYGKLAKLNLKGIKAGKRISMREKKHKTDFALWKFSSSSEKRQQEWQSPWGIGFPGWHIECSAMSMKYLGKHFDIHTGGEDHIQIHHTNEIAQSECATGKKFVNYWLHNAFLTFKGEKVSKSKGGFYTLSELEALGYKPEHFRYLTLLTHYRKRLDFNLENLDSVKSAFERAKRKIIELKKMKHQGKNPSAQYEREFDSAINDDLNMPKAIQIFWKVLDESNFQTEKKLKLIYEFDKVLGLNLKAIKEEKIIVPEEVKKMLKAREEARKAKLWAEADILRERIRELGFLIEDGEDGQRLKKI